MQINRLQICDDDCYRWHFNGQDFDNRNISSKHIVWVKKFKDDNVFELVPDGLKQYDELMVNVSERSDSQSMFAPFSYELLFNKNFLDADVVHYNLMNNNFFDLAHLPILSKLKPSVWTLYDDPLMPTKLKEIYFNQSKIDIIVTSTLMFDRVAASPLFKGKKVHVVPFGLNKVNYINKITEIYKEVIERHSFNSRDSFIISQQKKILAKRGAGVAQTQTEIMLDEVRTQNEIILHSESYMLANKLKNNKFIRVIYFILFRPAYRVLRKIKHYVKR